MPRRKSRKSSKSRRRKKSKPKKRKSRKKSPKVRRKSRKKSQKLMKIRRKSRNEKKSRRAMRARSKKGGLGNKIKDSISNEFNTIIINKQDIDNTKLKNITTKYTCNNSIDFNSNKEYVLKPNSFTKEDKKIKFYGTLADSTIENKLTDNNKFYCENIKVGNKNNLVLGASLFRDENYQELEVKGLKLKYEDKSEEIIKFNIWTSYEENHDNPTSLKEIMYKKYTINFDWNKKENWDLLLDNYYDNIYFDRSLEFFNNFLNEEQCKINILDTFYKKLKNKGKIIFTSGKTLILTQSCNYKHESFYGGGVGISVYFTEIDLKYLRDENLPFYIQKPDKNSQNVSIITKLSDYIIPFAVEYTIIKGNELITNLPEELEDKGNMFVFDNEKYKKYYYNTIEFPRVPFYLTDINGLKFKTPDYHINEISKIFLKKIIEKFHSDKYTYKFVESQFGPLIVLTKKI